MIIAHDHLEIHPVQLRLLRKRRTGHRHRRRTAVPDPLHHDWQDSKADNWFLRQAPQVLNLPFVDKIGRADRDNAIDVYIGEDYMDVLADGAWQKIFKEKPPVFTREEKRAWLDKMTGRGAGFRCILPLRRQYRACPQERREICGTAGRLRP